MAPNSRDLLFAYRWPAALVISSAFLAAALLKLLSQPIPIRIDGGLNVDRLVMPSTITIRTDEPLPVQAGVVVDGDASRKGEQPIRISGPVTVRGDVDARVAGDVDARVAGEVEVPSALTIRTDDPLDVINEVTNKDLTVTSRVTLEQPVEIKGSVDVKGKVGARIGL